MENKIISGIIIILCAILLFFIEVFITDLCVNFNMKIPVFIIILMSVIPVGLVSLGLIKIYDKIFSNKK
jgi:hypothetical protein